MDQRQLSAPLIFFKILFLFFICLSCSPSTEKFVGSRDESRARRLLLDEMLAESDLEGRNFSELLRMHGPVLSEEISYLSQKTKGSSQSVRRNAVSLLVLARDQEAVKPILKNLVLETEDLYVFAIALRPFLDDPEGKILAGLRPKMIEKGIHSQDPHIISSTLKGAWLIELPGIAKELEKRLQDPNDKVRLSALEILAESGAGLLAPQLKEILLQKKQRWYSYANVYQALSKTEDPSMAEAFEQSIDCKKETSESRDKQRDFFNGIASSKSRKPWLYQLLMGLVSKEGCLRWLAFDLLKDWTPHPPIKKLVQVCVTHFEQKLPRERSKKWLYDFEFEACKNYLSSLQENKKFNYDGLYEALDFGKEWLKKN